MKLPLKSLKIYLIGEVSKIIIFSLLIIDISLAILFYNITKIDFIILLVTMLSAILLETIYSRFLSKLYIRLIATVLLIYGYIRLLRFWDVKTLQQFFEIIEDINVKVYYSQEILFFDIMPLFLLIIAVATFIWYTAERKLKGNLVIIVQALYLVYISYYTTAFRNFYTASIALSTIYVCINIYRRTKAQAQREIMNFSIDFKRVSIYYGIVVSAVFVIAIGLVKATGTKSLSEIREALRDKILQNIYANIKQMYDISDYGFGTEKKLGGPLKLSDDIVFRVESDKPYYLRGTVKDLYNGYKWDRTNYGYNIQEKPNAYLLKAEVQKKLLGNDGVEGFKEPKNITVYNEDLKSTSLFTPYNTVMVTADIKYIGRANDNSYMFLERDADFKFYNSNFYESSTGYDNFEDFLKKNQKLDYEPSFNNPLKEKEVDNMKLFYDSYLQLPVNITERTKELQKRAVGDAKTVEEKIYNIMEFLGNNYPYELNVAKVPDNGEFLDYFLFVEKKGYCTYFATAAVIFCRLEGIPARYVEGFSMDNSKDEDGLYVVKGSNAHAWCEVLVSAKDNLWAVLESTPASGRPNGSSIEPSSKEINKLRGKNKHKFNFEKINNDEGGISSFNNIIKPVARIITIILYIIIILILCLFTIQVIYKVRKKKKTIKVITNNNKINHLYYYIKGRLKTIGIENHPNLSEHEYISSIEDEELKVYIKEIVSIYEQEYYGDKTCVLNYDNRRYLQQIEEYIRKKENILSYIVKKYELTLNIDFKNKNKGN